MKAYIPTYLKKQNRTTVLDLFLEHKELTRADVSKLTGISLPTVLKIVDFLRMKQILIDKPDALTLSDSGLGRKSQLLQLNENSYSTIGIYFEGNYLHVGLINLAYSIIDQKAFPLNSLKVSEDHFSSLSYMLTDTVRYLCSQHPTTEILGIGFGLPGIVDYQNKKIMKKNYQFFIEFYDLFPAFKELKDFPLFIENDINAASLGEILLRNRSHNGNLIYLSLGSGFGSGIIIDGEIWHGANNFAGDISNSILVLPTPSSAISPEDLRVEKSICLETLQKQFDFDIRYKETCDDRKRKEICQYLSYYLIPLVNNLSYTLDISDFVLAGLTTNFLGEELFTKLERGLEDLRTPAILRPETHIKPTISESTGIVGAAAIAFSNCLPKLLEESI